MLTLVSHFMVIIRYEKKYEEAKLKSAEQERDNIVDDEPTKVGAEAAQSLKKATSAAEQDLDVFLLGDLADSDEGPGAFSICTDLCFKAKIFSFMRHRYFLTASILVCHVDFCSGLSCRLLQ